jgi:hypothetical protein
MDYSKRREIMKNIKQKLLAMKRVLFFLLVLLTIVACSGSGNKTEAKLTTDTAEEIVRETLSEKPIYATVQITTGEIDPIMFEELSLYEKLQEEGYLKIQVKKEGNLSKTLLISLTNKAKDYLLKTKKSDYFPELSYNTMVMYTYALDKITDLEITNNSENFMGSKGTFTKKDPTPFYIFEKDQTSFFTRWVGFTKADKGWELTKEIK